MPEIRTGAAGVPTRSGLATLLRSESGKYIRRQLERRFDAILSAIASGDPEVARQATHARWILDNSHLVRQSLQQIETDLPADYYRQLPGFSNAMDRRTPRIFALVDEAVDYSDLPIDCAAIENFFIRVQSLKEGAVRLTLGEIWAVPIALRIILIARLCEAAVADTEVDPPNDDGVTVVAGCITSLRTVTTNSWIAFVDRVSLIERSLSKDPSGHYGRMDFATRDRYRGVVEHLARRARCNQWEVAEAAIRLAGQASQDGASMHRRHVGFYLIDDGRGRLEREIDYHPSLSEHFRRGIKKHGGVLYVGAIMAIALTLSIALVHALMADHVAPLVTIITALIALIPLLSVSSGAINFVLSVIVAPQRLPKLDFGDGIPDDHVAIVVVPMLLGTADEIAQNIKTLEQNYLGNSDPGLRFALLSDFTDAADAETPQDQALLAQAVQGIDGLNDRYAANGVHPFAIFHRRRLWNDNAQCWMGRERKRGKLEEFNALARGATDTSFVLQHGAEHVEFGRIRYVITLDADSYMPTGTANRLVGTMAHPLNRPCFDDATNSVTRGYTLLQPRLETNPVSGADTLFARFFTGDVTLDLYTNAVSDTYQDLFGDAVFAGKGVYDLDGFRRSVDGQIPPNRVLSHDLLEGLHGRVGLVSDIVVLENYPSNYLAYLKRLHRWTRGDWQLIPWLSRRKDVVTPRFKPGFVGYWKLFDNLRRSLVNCAVLLLLLVGWLTPSVDPLMWTLWFALLPGLPILLRVTLALRTASWRWGTIESSLRNLANHAGADSSRWLLALVFIPTEAHAAADAISRTLYRMYVSHRNLLEWVSAAAVSRMLGHHRSAFEFTRQLWFSPAVAIASATAIIAARPQALPAAAPLLMLWLAAPLIAYALGYPIAARGQRQLPETDRLFVRGLAHDTWRFFERFVGPDTCWLPPDNIQETPKRVIAERTSPTNIGMMLLSTLTAYDLGYIGQRQLLARLQSHLDSVERLQKHRGHLLNWYSTRDLQPLEPRYISTVDSGNFIAALIIVREMLQELPNNPHAVERSVMGLSDELAALRRHLFADDGALPNDAATTRLIGVLDAAQGMLLECRDPLAAVHQFEHQYCGEIEQAFLATLDEHSSRWSAETIANFRENSQVFRQRIRIILADIEMYSPWSEKLLTPPTALLAADIHRQFEQLASVLLTLNDIDTFEQWGETAVQLIAELMAALSTTHEHDRVAEAKTWLAALKHDISSTRTRILALARARQRLVRTIDDAIDATDFKFLYDPNRDLFRVGYNASTGEVDTSHYDLLASEARIASFVAIANGDIPAKHWMHLGRPLTRIRGLRILLSWSATAFEYLMPRLIMRSPPAGLLDQSCEGVVKEQIRFGHEHDIPWGVSESGYAQFDPQGNYQYFGFGIPKLGLKWDQGERLVVSSYSSLLAMPYAPAETVHNLRRLVGLGGAGHYGLYEALDFGDAHRPRPSRPHVVRSYMAHHQGMILVAIGNAVHGDRMLERFHRNPRIASVEYLLHERLPTRMETRPLERLPAPLKELPADRATVVHWTTDAARPELALLSNGRLTSRISDQGSGALYWRTLALTRWNPLADGPFGGTCVYLKDLDSGRLRSLGAQPVPTDVETIFAPYQVEFRTRRDEMLLRMTIAVAPAADVEIRRITVTNDSPVGKRIVLASYSEPVLSSEDADRRHPAFSKMFVETQLREEENTLLFRRRSRDSSQPSVYLAQTAITRTEFERDRAVAVDRGAFVGRDGSLAAPAALTEPEHDFDAAANANLDPCAAIVVTLDIPSHSTVQCAFLTSVAESRSAALSALHPFRSFERLGWIFETARLHSERELTGMRLDSDTVRAAYELLPRILWPRNLTHIGVDAFDSLTSVQDVLWRHGISGDRPIVTVSIQGQEDLTSVAALLDALRYLSHHGFAVDVVFLDHAKDGYNAPVNDQLRKLIEKNLAPGNDSGGAAAFIIPARQLSAGENTALIAAARLFIGSRVRALSEPRAAAARTDAWMPAFIPQPSAPLSTDAIAPVTARDDLSFATPLGGMLPDFRGYCVLTSSASRTPAPWSNVLANPTFGSLVSESGAMCTWWGNSSENRLTPWSNDPVLDRTGEAVYLRDEETGDSWSLTPQPRPGPSPYRVTHAIGESTFEHNSHGLEQQLQVFVDATDPIKYLRINLVNKWPRARRITITFCVEWLLGNSPGFNSHLLVPERDEQTDALLIRNAFARHGGDEVAFVAANLRAHGVTCDGYEFFGKRYSWDAPAALTAVGLSDRVQPNARPCAAYQVHLDLQKDETRELHFVLGAAKSLELARKFITQSTKPGVIDERYHALCLQWDRLLNTWQVKTPDAAADAMINHWLLYQVVSSRLWGRIGFYQASGGFGYRDQLQDVLALLDTQPELARRQILLAATRQFERGDVLHWWHEEPLRGVRTRCSDDLLWLAYATAEYVEVTDDSAILRATAPYLEGEPLASHELERYARFQATQHVASLYEHCCRAIDARLEFGAHGIPFIGTGDWNDSLNRVGEKGRGESVWMAWFLVIVCRRFAPLCRMMDDDRRAEDYTRVADDLLRRTQSEAWTGEWYLRGYYDDGTPLGAPGADESEIDLNAQTWAVIADPNDPSARHAMRSVETKLVDADRRLIKLLAPPFEKSAHDPGYIMSYPPGVRENGGQYTHAAVWAPWAAALIDDKDNALRWFKWLIPLDRARSAAEVDHYRLEPYVMAGDIYGVGELAGRGGWSWYTGSAAWMYRFAIRQLLGLRRRGNRLYVRPCLPDVWPAFQATFRYKDAAHELHVHDPANFTGDILYIVKNGTVYDAAAIDLEESGEHHYEIFASSAARRTWLSEMPPRYADAPVVPEN